MKFFTIEWWSGDVEDENGVFDEYRKFLEPFLSELPLDHRRLTSEISLHDAKLLSYDTDYTDNTLAIELDGFGYDEKTDSHFRRSFTLRYEAVSSITITANPDKGLGGPHGFGDLGYDEIELLEPGFYEHRMLFSTGVVLRVRHRRFQLGIQDYEQKDAEQD